MPITTSNATTVAKGAVNPSQGMVQTGSGMTGVVGVVTQTSGYPSSILDISLAEFKRARSLTFSPAVIGVNKSVTLQCTSSGTITGTVQDRDASNSFTVGDILTMTFNNCVEPTTSLTHGSTKNGSATFAINSANGALGLVGSGTPSNPFTASFTLTFSNFSSKDNVTNLTDTANGDISFSISDDGTNTTGTMLGQYLKTTNTADGAFRMTNYNLSFTEANFPTSSSPYNFSVNMTVASTIANGSVTITTPITFAGTGIGNPTAGEMVITGANGSTLTLTALPDGIHVRLVVDEDGSGPNPPVLIINPGTSTNYTWTEL